MPDDSPETAIVRDLLDQLLNEARIYRSTDAFKALMTFVVRLRNFAPFNAMLLQIQKPGLMYAASAYDWYNRFRRYPKEGARPLIILWPFGPVALVYDVADTKGEPLPDGVNAFAATGDVTAASLAEMVDKLRRKEISWVAVDEGDGSAGSIERIGPSLRRKAGFRYKLRINKNHGAAIQFASLVHELGHLYLGHLGPDSALRIPERGSMRRSECEIEAECVSFLVCTRNGVASRSADYLADHVERVGASYNLYQIMRAAGQIEAILGLTAHAAFEPETGFSQAVRAAPPFTAGRA